MLGGIPSSRAGPREGHGAMQTGRKILNLRRDRHISQQDLARACEITPSALSKIEAGINSPRAQIIWRLAQQLGVTVEYLLDEELPYPYTPYAYRQALFSGKLDPDSKVRMEVTREEKAFLEALRESHDVATEIAFAIPEMPVENMRMIHFLVHHAKITNPTPNFFNQFEKMIRSQGEPKTPKTGRPTGTMTSRVAKLARLGRSRRSRK